MGTTPPPTKGGINGCRGIAGYLATGPQNLQFMASYFNNENVCEFQYKHTYSSRSPGHVTQFGER